MRAILMVFHDNYASSSKKDNSDYIPEVLNRH